MPNSREATELLVGLEEVLASAITPAPGRKPTDALAQWITNVEGPVEAATVVLTCSVMSRSIQDYLHELGIDDLATFRSTTMVATTRVLHVDNGPAAEADATRAVLTGLIDRPNEHLDELTDAVAALSPQRAAAVGATAVLGLIKHGARVAGRTPAALTEPIFRVARAFADQVSSPEAVERALQLQSRNKTARARAASAAWSRRDDVVWQSGAGVSSFRLDWPLAVFLRNGSVVDAVDVENGQRRWDRQIDPLPAATRPGEVSSFDLGPDVTLRHGHLLVTGTIGDRSGVWNLDLRDGSVRWTTRVLNPDVSQFHGLVALTENGSLRATRCVMLAAEDGREYWHASVPGQVAAFAPSAQGSVMLAALGGDLRLLGYAPDGTRRWELPIDAPPNSFSFSIDADVTVFAHVGVDPERPGRSRAIGVDLRTGNVLWAVPDLDHDKPVAAWLTGTAAVLNAGDGVVYLDGDKIRRHIALSGVCSTAFAPNVWERPEPEDHVLLIHNEDRLSLVAWDGAPIRSWQSSRPVDTAITRNRLCVATADSLTVMDGTGRTRWESAVPVPLAAVHGFGDRHVVVEDTDGLVITLALPESARPSPEPTASGALTLARSANRELGGSRDSQLPIARS